MSLSNDDVNNIYSKMTECWPDYYPFLNHGYYPFHEKIMDLSLCKAQASLYFQMFDGIDTQGLKILDVGCGRGGFLSLADRLGFAEMHGCDTHNVHIDICKRTIKNAEFKTCDAGEIHLVYPHNYFDIVINVESSHCYENVPMFLRAVKKVMKKDGIFLHADSGINLVSALGFTSIVSFKNVKQHIITKNVLDGTIVSQKELDAIQDPMAKEILKSILVRGELFYRNGSVFYKTTCTDRESVL